MTAQALPTATPPPRAGLRQLLTNGWGARLILVGSFLSFLSLSASWGIIVSAPGHAEYGYRDGSTSELRHAGATTYTHVAGNTVDGGSEFARDSTSAWFFAALMGLSVYIAARPLRPDQTSLRWVPIGCTAILLLNGVTSAVQAVRDSQTFLAGSPPEISVSQGMGPFCLVLFQVIAGLGGLLFLRSRPVPVG